MEETISLKKRNIQPTLLSFTIVLSKSYGYCKYLGIKNEKFVIYPYHTCGMVKFN